MSTILLSLIFYILQEGRTPDTQTSPDASQVKR